MAFDPEKKLKEILASAALAAATAFERPTHRQVSAPESEPVILDHKGKQVKISESPLDIYRRFAYDFAEPRNITIIQEDNQDNGITLSTQLIMSGPEDRVFITEPYERHQTLSERLDTLEAEWLARDEDRLEREEMPEQDAGFEYHFIPEEGYQTSEGFVFGPRDHPVEDSPEYFSMQSEERQKLLRYRTSPYDDMLERRMERDIREKMLRPDIIKDLPEQPFPEDPGTMMLKELLGVMLGIEPSMARPERTPRKEFNYSFQTERSQEELYKTIKGMCEYMHDNDVENLILLDRGARPAFTGVMQYWRMAYPDKERPKIFFIDPKEITPKFSPCTSRHIENAAADLRELHTYLASRKDKKTLIFDTCIHSGDSLDKPKRVLEEAGFEDVRTGVVGRPEPYTRFQVDFYTIDGIPDMSCRPFGLHSNTLKTDRNSTLLDRHRAKNLRREIKSIVKERYAHSEERAERSYHLNDSSNPSDYRHDRYERVLTHPAMAAVMLMMAIGGGRRY